MFSGYLAAFIFLGIAMVLVLGALGVSFTNSQLVLFSGILAAIPTAAMISGMLLDRVALRPVHGRLFQLLGVSLTMVVALNSGVLFEFIVAALHVTEQAGILELSAFVLALGNQVI
ncbi:MAG: hypothetical protein KDD42_04310, partial [Bdellovibrionales bacterium]|nr:hypothetical protein [Bdellovibrionales bacterium]